MASEADGKQSDERLLEMHAQSGTNEYLGQLYSRYIPLVYGLSLKYLRNEQDAADAVMDIFEDLVRKVDKYKIEVFRTWLYSVARNHCFQILRKKGVEVPLENGERVMENDDLVHLLIEGGREKRFELLEKCLEKLPEKQRLCIEKFFFANKSYADITAETRYQLKNVKSYIQNGKRNLRICIEKNSNEAD